jgi:cell division protein FtsI/penicillin-binding protein 2
MVSSAILNEVKRMELTIVRAKDYHEQEDVNIKHAAKQRKKDIFISCQIAVLMRQYLHAHLRRKNASNNARLLIHIICFQFPCPERNPSSAFLFRDFSPVCFSMAT